MNPEAKTLLQTMKTIPEHRKIKFIYQLGKNRYCIHLPLSRKQQDQFLQKLGNKLPDKYHITIYDQLPLDERKQSYKGKLIHFQNKQNPYSAAINTMRQFKKGKK